MNALVVTVAIYFLAGLVASKYCLPLPADSRHGGPRVLLALLANLLWPLWLAITANDWWRARRAKPSYLAVVAEITALTAKAAELSNSIDGLIEKLTGECDENLEDVVVTKLAAANLERSRLENSVIPASRKLANTVYSKHSAFYDKELTLPKPPQWGLELPLRAPLDEDTASRLIIELDLHGDSLTAHGRALFASQLRRHLLGLSSHHMGTLDRLNQGQNALATRRPGVRPSSGTLARKSDSVRESLVSRKWSLVFSGQFRKALRDSSKVIQQKTQTAIQDVLIDPMTPKGHTKAPLRHDKRGKWKYRIGNYRIIYLPIIEQRELVFVDLIHRKEAYQ